MYGRRARACGLGPHSATSPRCWRPVPPPAARCGGAGHLKTEGADAPKERSGFRTTCSPRASGRRRVGEQGPRASAPERSSPAGSGRPGNARCRCPCRPAPARPAPRAEWINTASPGAGRPWRASLGRGRSSGTTTASSPAPPPPPARAAGRRYRSSTNRPCPPPCTCTGASPRRTPTAARFPFTQIGGDGGLPAAPQRPDRIPMAPAELFDAVVDFTDCPVGSHVTLVNTLADDRMHQVMRFRVARKENDVGHVRARLPRHAALCTPHPPSLPGTSTSAAPTTRGPSTGGPSAPRRSWPARARAPRSPPAPGHGRTPAFHQRLPPPGACAPGPLPGPVARRPGARTHRRGLEGHGRRPPVRGRGRTGPLPRPPGRYMLHCHNLEHEDMAMTANSQAA